MHRCIGLSAAIGVQMPFKTWEINDILNTIGLVADTPLRQPTLALT